MRDVQAKMQPPMSTVRDQREQQVLDMTRNEVAQQAQQGAQQLALNQQRAMQARGIPTQAAPNMRGMMGGGIVGYQLGGAVQATEDPSMMEKAARLFLGDESYDIIRQRLESNKANTQMPQPQMTDRERVTQLQELILKRKAAGAGDDEIQRIQQEIQSYDIGGMKSSGLKGFQQGGIVGLELGGTPEDRMKELDIDPDYNIFTGTLDAIGRGVQSAATAIPEFLASMIPGGGSVGEARMAKREYSDAVEAAYPDATPDQVEAITRVAMARDEEAPPPAPVSTYAGSDQQVEDMLKDTYRDVQDAEAVTAPEPTGDGLAGLAAAMAPSRLEELRKQRADIMGGITSPERLQRDKLRAFLTGMGERGLGAGSEALTKEQQRQDALRVGDLDRLIELEREDVKLQREIDASMAEVVANNEAELAQIMAKAGLEEQMNRAGDRRGFIADVLKQLKDNLPFQQTMLTLNERLREGDITAGDYTRAQLDAIQQATQALGVQYDVDTGLGGAISFTSGSFQ